MSDQVIFNTELEYPSFLLVPNTEQPETYQSITDLLRTKQELFKHDPESWYGLRIPVSRIKKKNSDCFAIKLTPDQLIDMLINKNVPILLSGWLKVLHTVIQSEPVPDKLGKWHFPSFPEYIPPYIHVMENNELRTVPETSVPWQKLITKALMNTAHMQNIRQKKLEHLDLYTGHVAIKQWSRKLFEEEGDATELPDPLYQLARHILNGDRVKEIFQLELIVSEPHSSEDDSWLIGGMIHELQSEKRIHLEAFSGGENPFKSYPSTWLNEQFCMINALLPGDTGIAIHDYTPAALTALEVERFIQDAIPQLKALGIEVWLPKSIRTASTPTVKLTLPIDEENTKSPWITSNTDWKLVLDDQEIEEKILRKFVAEERSIIQLNESWYVWDLDTAKQLIKQIDEPQASTSNLLFQGLRQEAGNIDEDMHAFHIELDDLFEQLRTLTEKQLQSTWKTRLREYQVEGVRWLLSMRAIGVGALLADDMGLGKTKQVISYFDHVREKEMNSAFLILCPSSLLYHWEQELSETFAKSSVLIHQGPVTKRRMTYQNAGKDVKFFIISYATAVRDEDLLRDRNWSAIIYDEAQKIKNIHTQQRKTAGRLSAKHSIALSGTPVENHPDEIWSLSNLLNPGYLGETETFGQNLQTHGIDALKEQIRPVMLRRTKKEVQPDLQLPDRNFHHHTVTLSVEQQSLYKACVEELMDNLEDATESEQRVRMFKTMMKLKQICNHPAQLKKETGISRFQPGRSHKWDHAQDLLRTWAKEQRKGIIFTQFRYIGKLFMDYHRVQGGMAHIPFLHGGLSAAKREKMIKSFKADPEIPYMVISLRAGGFGLNLTEASTVLHFDRWWNPAVENQATDRVHRIGQTIDVDIHTLTAKGTIEERIHDLISRKEELQEALLSGRPLPLWTLNPNEIKELMTFK